MTAHLQGKTQARYPNPNTTENRTIQAWPSSICTTPLIIRTARRVAAPWLARSKRVRNLWNAESWHKTRKKWSKTIKIDPFFGAEKGQERTVFTTTPTVQYIMTKILQKYSNFSFTILRTVLTTRIKYSTLILICVLVNPWCECHPIFIEKSSHRIKEQPFIRASFAIAKLLKTTIFKVKTLWNILNLICPNLFFVNTSFYISVPLLHLSSQYHYCQGRISERGALGHLSFRWLQAGVTYLAVCLKSVKRCPSYVWCPLKYLSLLCELWFYICLRCSTEIKIFPTFL